MNRYAPFPLKRFVASAGPPNLPEMETQYLARRVATLAAMAPEESCKHIAALKSHGALSASRSDDIKR